MRPAFLSCFLDHSQARPFGLCSSSVYFQRFVYCYSLGVFILSWRFILRPFTAS